MRTVNGKNADIEIRLKQTAGEKSSKLKLMDVFYAELGRLKRIAAGFGLSASDGEDVLQDVSIKALERSGENRTHQEYIRWLTKVTINRCLTEHRRRRSVASPAARLAVPGAVLLPAGRETAVGDRRGHARRDGRRDGAQR